MSTAAPPPNLLIDLQRPESYPAPHPRAVTLVSTHISWVFLTDETAWKVKRPVNLGFVDFSRLEARRHFCEEELRLNARLAPGVYQAVVPIVLGPTGHRFGDEGRVVDYAVKMRRLPDWWSAAARLRSGQLSAEHLAALAARLAQFYAEAPAAPAFADVGVMRKNVEENFDQLAAFAGNPLDQRLLAEVSDRQRSDLQLLRPALEARPSAGKIREGHGDLRLEHVYFPDDDTTAPLVIDCVEFAERFRSGDVALDAAFIAMELDAAGAASSAEYFLYRFARESNDFDLYSLADFYLCYRALVRTKIACLLAADPSTPADKARSKRAEAERLLRLAHKYTHRRPGPAMVIAVGGLVGAGKSTAAELLARHLGLAVVSSDVVRKQLAGLPPTAKGDAALYAPSFTAGTYDEVFRRAALVLGSGRSIVLDATFRSIADRARARRLAAAHGAGFLFVEVGCDEATLRHRLRQRAGHPAESDADERVLDRLIEEFVPPTELAPREVLLWKSSDAADELVAAVRSAWPGPRATEANSDLNRTLSSR